MTSKLDQTRLHEISKCFDYAIRNLDRRPEKAAESFNEGITMLNEFNDKKTAEFADKGKEWKPNYQKLLGIGTDEINHVHSRLQQKILR